MDKPSGYLMTTSNEPSEQHRLDLQHQIWLLTLHNRLYTVPFFPHVKSILDIGCGTGAWAHAVALERPATSIIAIDLTPPNVTPPSNMTFLKADAEKEWDFPLANKFWFIHARMLTSGIHDWPLLLARCWEHLEPGGRLELLDVCHPFRAGDISADSSSSSNFIKWGHMAEECWAMNGLDYRATEKHVQRLHGLGFVNVVEMEKRWPLGEWELGEHEKQIGALVLKNFEKFLDMAGVGILTQDTNISEEEAMALVKGAREDLMENCCQKRFYLTMKIHTAQKPWR